MELKKCINLLLDPHFNNPIFSKTSELENNFKIQHTEKHTNFQNTNLTLKPTCKHVHNEVDNQHLYISETTAISC
jgi:hypothetical protein